ncbi:MAG: hypothetical protein JJ974_00545 [Phycisphaerales bacterium]|nr:hypothetical protein [Phycisphaerales bacterium]
MEMIEAVGILGTIGLGAVGVVLLVGMIYWIIKEAEKAKARAAARLAAMVAFAERNGLVFRPEPNASHDEEFYHIELFQRGFAKRAYNTISGIIENGELSGRVTAGDYTYKTRETYTTTDSKGRTRTRTRIVTHRFSYFIYDTGYAQMPDLLIRREGVFDRIASLFGKNDIDFESSEFSKKYYVKCDSRKFAYDVVHQRMIEFLLETEPGLIDIERGRICLSDGYSVWDADRFVGSLGWTLEFLGRWPDYLVEDLEEGKLS